MADLSEILENISNSNTNVKDLTKSLNELGKAREKAFAAGDPKLLLQIREMEKSVRRLIKTTQDQSKIENEIKELYKNKLELTDEQIEAYARAAKEHEKSTSQFLKNEQTLLLATERKENFQKNIKRH